MRRAGEAEARVTEALARYRTRCEELAFWSSRECKIKASPFAGLGLGAQVRLKPNVPQRRLCALIDRMKREGGIVNGISLKTRKYGGTSQVLAALTREAVLVPHTSALVMAHHDKTATEIAGLAFQMFKHLDIAAQFSHLEGSSHRKLTNGSRMDVHTAGTHEPPAFGFAFDVALVSEFAHVLDPEKAWSAVRNAAIAARFFWVESQANGRGNMFHTMWQEAMTEAEFFATPVGSRRGCKFFVPFFECEWYRLPVAEDMSRRHRELAEGKRWSAMWKEGLVVDDEEEGLVARFDLGAGQIAWRRWAVKELCGNDASKFREQYPVDEETAFLTGGSPVFPLEVLEYRLAHVAEPMSRGTVRDGCFREGEGDCDVWIWKDPEERTRYVAGVDVSAGDADGDLCAMEMLSRNPREQVAEYVGHCRPKVLAEICDVLGRLYNGATVGSERDGVNFAFLERMEEDYHYPDIYRHVEADAAKITEFPKIGIKVSSHTRQVLIDRGRACVCDVSVPLPSSRLCEQIATLVFDRRHRVNHPSFGHDDAFRALCAAVFVMAELGDGVAAVEARPEPANNSPRAIRPWRFQETSEGYDATLGNTW